VTGFYTIFHNKCDYRSKVSGFEVRWTVRSIAERKKKKKNTTHGSAHEACHCNMDMITYTYKQSDPGRT
jgi:hypothetical protein